MDKSSDATEHTATVTPAAGAGATASCTCGWKAFGGADLTVAGAERAASIHTR